MDRQFLVDLSRTFHSDIEGHKICIVITLIVVKNSKAWFGWQLGNWIVTIDGEFLYSRLQTELLICLSDFPFRDTKYRTSYLFLFSCMEYVMTVLYHHKIYNIIKCLNWYLSPGTFHGWHVLILVLCLMYLNFTSVTNMQYAYKMQYVTCSGETGNKSERQISH